MIDPKATKEPQPEIAVVPKSSSGKAAMMSDPVPSQHMIRAIRARAYELYENRGHEPGQDEQDWLRAEREILNAER
jgi:Protein of unknown function (DUF2934)